MSDYRTEVDKQIRAFVLSALGQAETALKKGNVERAESLHTCAQKMFARRRGESPLEDLDIASKGLQVGLEIRRQKILAESPEDKTEISYTEKFAAFVREATPAMVALLKLKSSAGGQTDGARDEAANGEAAAENIADATEKSKSGATTQDDVLNFLAELAELNVKHGVDIVSPRGFYLVESLERTEYGAKFRFLAKSGTILPRSVGKNRYPTEWVDDPKEEDFRNYSLELHECQENLAGAKKTVACLREDLDHAKRVISLKDTEISQLKTAYNALIDDYDGVSRELSAAREDLDNLRSMAAAFKVHRAVSPNYIKI